MNRRFPDRVLRAEPTPSDLAAGLPGKLLQLDVSRMNFGRLDHERHRRRGELRVRHARQVVSLRIRRRLGSTSTRRSTLPASRLRIASTSPTRLGTIAKWRAIASVDWQRGALGATCARALHPVPTTTRVSGVRNGRTIAITDVSRSSARSRSRQGHWMARCCAASSSRPGRLERAR